MVKRVRIKTKRTQKEELNINEINLILQFVYGDSGDEETDNNIKALQNKLSRMRRELVKDGLTGGAL